MQTVEIESDGLDARWEGIAPPKLDTMQDFLDAVRASGLVGLGGAGFPTVVKLTVKNLDQIKCVIINGAECEPYITSDTRARRLGAGAGGQRTLAAGNRPERRAGRLRHVPLEL